MKNIINSIENEDVKYCKQKRLGEGLFGRAYRVKNEKTGETCTAKITKNENDTHINNEAAVFSELHHLCILKSSATAIFINEKICHFDRILIKWFITTSFRFHKARFKIRRIGFYT